jgi:hypothetical protein
VLAPVSGFNTAYAVVQGLKGSVVNPKLRATERLYMSPLSAEGEYSRWNFVLPGAVLNDMSLMNSTGVRVKVEFWYIEGDFLGVEKYNTEVSAEIIAALAADYPSATDDQFVRVIDTDTDWYYDADLVTWVDYEAKKQVGVSKQVTEVADFALEQGIFTEDPSHAPSNTELILEELSKMLRKDGTRKMTDDLDMDSNDIDNVGSITLYSADGTVVITFDGTNLIINRGSGNEEVMTVTNVLKDLANVVETSIADNDILIRSGANYVNITKTAFLSALQAEVDANANSIGANATAISLRELLANKIVSWGTPNDTQYPSAKLVKDTLDTKETIINVNTKISTHNSAVDSHTDIRSLISALQGAYVFRGLISNTTAEITADTTLLTTYIDTNFSRTPVTGDVLVDTDDNEWYYDGDSWENMGQAIISLASAVNDGLMSKEDYSKLLAFDVATAYYKASELDAGQLDNRYYTESEVDGIISDYFSGYGVTQTDLTPTPLGDTGVLALSTLTDKNQVLFVCREIATGEIDTDKVPMSELTNGTVLEFFDNATITATVGATDITFSNVATGYTLKIYGIELQPMNDEQIVVDETGSNYLDSATNQQEANQALDTQIKTNADNIVSNDTDILNLKTKDAELDKKLADTQETLRKINAGEETGTAQGTDVIALGKDVANAELKVKQEGLLLDSENKFNLTTTTTNGITATVSGNQITLSGTATAETTFTLVTGLTATDKAYINQDYVSGTSDGVITLFNGVTALNAVYGTDYSGVVTLEGTTITLVVANGATLTNVIYKVNINDTETDIANKQYSPMYDTTFDLMSDSEIKAQMDLWVQNGTLPNNILSENMNKRYRAVGKNLFDRNDIVLSEEANSLTGILQPTVNNRNRTNYIKIIGGVNYTRYIDNNMTYSNYISWYDYDKNYISRTLSTFVDGATTDTSPSNAIYAILSYSKEADLDTLQLEQGSTATTYEPYVNHDMFVNGGVGYSIGDTKDSVDTVNGKLIKTQRIGTDDVTGVVSVDLTNYPDAKSGGVFINYLTAGGSETGIIGTDSTSGDGFLTYELATPIETELQPIGNLQGHPNGTVYVDNVYQEVLSYSSGLTTTYDISTIDKLIKINSDGSQTEFDTSTATLTSNQISAITGATDGDLFYVEYYYTGTYVDGLTTINYYMAMEDLRFPVTALSQPASGRPDFDSTNIGYLFPNGNTNEILYIIAQLPHNRVTDSPLVPHVHCRLAGSGQPVFKIDYKIYNPDGEAIPATFTTYTMNVNTATWSSGTISNMVYGESPISGVGYGDSAIMIMKLYRDDTAYVGDILVDEFDIHYYVAR